MAHTLVERPDSTVQTEQPPFQTTADQAVPGLVLVGHRGTDEQDTAGRWLVSVRFGKGLLDHVLPYQVLFDERWIL